MKRRVLFAPEAQDDLLSLYSYIAEQSGHSTGAAVDLTLVELKAGNSAVFDPSKAYADCTAPATARAPEGTKELAPEIARRL